MFKIDLQITIITYEQDGIYIVYAPQLDLSGYDTTLKKAHNSFKIVLEEYLRYTIAKGTLFDDLKKHGWTITKNKLKPPSNQDVNIKLKEIPLYNKIEQHYQVELA